MIVFIIVIICIIVAILIRKKINVENAKIVQRTQEEMTERFSNNPVTEIIANDVCQEVTQIINAHLTEINTNIKRIIIPIGVYDDHIGITFQGESYWRDKTSGELKISDTSYKIIIDKSEISSFKYRKSIYFSKYNTVGLKNNIEKSAFRDSLFKILQKKYSYESNFNLSAGSLRNFSEHFTDYGIAIYYMCPNYKEPDKLTEW